MNAIQIFKLIDASLCRHPGLDAAVSRLGRGHQRRHGDPFSLKAKINFNESRGRRRRQGDAVRLGGKG